MSIRLIRALVLLSCVVFTSSAYGAIVYAINSQGGQNLVRFDSTDPVNSIITIGPTGYDGLVHTIGLDFTSDGQLWAVGNAVGRQVYFSVDKDTGAFTEYHLPNWEDESVVTDLAVSTTGILVALEHSLTTGQVYATSFDPNSRVDTGRVPLFLPENEIYTGITINSNNEMYIHSATSDHIYLVDQGTLQGIQLPNPVGFDSVEYSGGMATHWTGTGEWGFVAYGDTPSYSSHYMTIDATGAGTIVGTWPNDGPNNLPVYRFDDMAFQPVPEPASMLALGAGLVALLRRRRKA